MAADQRQCLAMALHVPVTLLRDDGPRLHCTEVFELVLQPQASVADLRAQLMQQQYLASAPASFTELTYRGCELDEEQALQQFSAASGGGLPRFAATFVEPMAVQLQDQTDKVHDACGVLATDDIRTLRKLACHPSGEDAGTATELVCVGLSHERGLQGASAGPPASSCRQAATQRQPGEPWHRAGHAD